jgi:alanine-glyoxylate transaminase/serine-glyoxylate transaminase/serine-pyruvate transaminase
VHNETSTGVTSRIAAIRQAIDRAGHPALFMVDTVSGLGSLDYRHDAWGVDVSVAGSQKGLMLPPGLSFNAVSDKALGATKTSRLPKSYWGWDDIIAMNRKGYFPYTPATNLLYGLHESTAMLLEEGLTTSSRVTIGMPKRRAARSAPGASRSCAAIPLNTAAC